MKEKRQETRTKDIEVPFISKNNWLFKNKK